MQNCHLRLSSFSLKVLSVTHLFSHGRWVDAALAVLPSKLWEAIISCELLLVLFHQMQVLSKSYLLSGCGVNASASKFGNWHSTQLFPLEKRTAIGTLTFSFQYFVPVTRLEEFALLGWVHSDANNLYFRKQDWQTRNFKMAAQKLFCLPGNYVLDLKRWFDSQDDCISVDIESAEPQLVD